MIDCKEVGKYLIFKNSDGRCFLLDYSTNVIKTIDNNTFGVMKTIDDDAFNEMSESIMS